MRLSKSLQGLKILILLLVLLPISLQAGLRHADRLFERFDFVNAAQAYEKYYKKHPGDVAVAEKIATCYRLMNDWTSAEPWYQITAATPNPEPENIYYYAQSARVTENYTVSNAMFMKHYELTGDAHSASMVLSQDELSTLYDAKGYEIKILQTNSKASDFGPALYGDQLYFTSNRGTKKFASEPQDYWSNTNFLQMHQIDTAKEMEQNTVPQWDLKKLNGKYHDGPIAFHPVTGDIYLTRTNYTTGKAGKSMDRTAKLKIFKLAKKGDTWSTKLEDGVTFNNAEYSVGHVTFNADGSVMYFSSDMPGGYGLTDIWMAEKVGDSYSNPVNLGPTINTKGEEMYPFMSDGLLYFASSGHKGLGGLDVYAANLTTQTITNVGAPINSNFDDFALMFQPGSVYDGYFTSNRPGTGNDDIYKFKKKTVLEKVYVYDVSNGQALPNAMVKFSDSEYLYPTNGEGEVIVELTGAPTAEATYPKYEQVAIEYNTTEHYASIGMLPMGNKLEVLVLDKETSNPIPNAKVTLNGKSYYTDANGYMSTITEPQVPYSIKVEKDLISATSKYFPESGTFNTGALQAGEVFGLTAYLSKFEKGQQVEIKDIYYDLDKYYIRPDAAGELKNLVATMKAYPTMEIQLGAHTDCRMPKAYNQTLSENRAKAAMDYLVSRGISKDRMSYVGYGETQTVNGCDCECNQPVSQIGVSAFRDCEDKQVANCSDADHQDNRRTVFVITKF